MKRWTLWLFGGAALVAGLAACPQFAPDDVCGYPGFCGDASSADGGDGGNKDAGPDAPASCPSGSEPKDDPTCVTDALGIFVAPSGSDGNPGTKLSPVATVKQALALAKTGGQSFVFVCEGSYTESVDVAQSISIFGGWKCSDWSYTGTQPKFTATKPRKKPRYPVSFHRGVVAPRAARLARDRPPTQQRRGDREVTQPA